MATWVSAGPLSVSASLPTTTPLCYAGRLIPAKPSFPSLLSAGGASESWLASKAAVVKMYNDEFRAWKPVDETEAAAMLVYVQARNYNPLKL